MSGPISPHVRVEAHADGVLLGVKGQTLVVPVDMALLIAGELASAAAKHDPLGVEPLPPAVVAGDPVK